MSTASLVFLAIQLAMTSNYLTQVMQTSSIVYDDVLPCVKSMTSTTIKGTLAEDTFKIFSNLLRGGGQQDDKNKKVADDDPSDSHHFADELGRLNVVVLYPNDWMHDAIGDERPGVVHTPFLTKLAKEGIRFTHKEDKCAVCRTICDKISISSGTKGIYS
jgi:hypothetical protein